MILPYCDPPTIGSGTGSEKCLKTGPFFKIVYRSVQFSQQINPHPRNSAEFGYHNLGKAPRPVVAPTSLLGHRRACTSYKPPTKTGSPASPVREFHVLKVPQVLVPVLCFSMGYWMVPPAFDELRLLFLSFSKAFYLPPPTEVLLVDL